MTNEERERLEKIQDDISKRLKELDKELFTIRLTKGIAYVERFFLTIWRCFITSLVWILGGNYDKRN